MNRIAKKSFASVALCLLSFGASADYISFSEDFDVPTSGISYVGNASQVGTWGRLTNNATSQRGAIWNTTAYNFRSFQVQFDFLIGPSTGGGADGITFTVLGAGSHDPNTALGGGGGGLGYLGLSNSFAIEFDTWFNAGFDDDANHVGINQNGSINSLARANVGIPFETTDSSRWLTAVIAMDSSGLIDVSVEGTSYLSYTLSGYSNQAYFGFTGATGAAIDYHYIDNWNMRIEVPEPGTLGLLGLGLLGLGLTRRAKKF